MAGRIVVVGNNAIVALDIEQTLAANGYEVETAVSVKPSAIRMVLRNSPDLVVLDVSAHRSDGVTAARQMYEAVRVPFLLLTVLTQAEIEQCAELSGPIRYLSKPFRDHDLLRLVRKSLDGTSTMRARRTVSKEWEGGRSCLP